MINSIRKGLSSALCALITLVLAAIAAYAEMPIKQADERDQDIRVLLTRLSLSDRIDITLSSAYALKTDDGSDVRFSGGSELAVLIKNGDMYLHCEGISFNAGKSLRLMRYAVEDGVEYGFRRANFPALYAGDLTLYIEDGVLKPVLTINVEDYLLGVVPYEMSDGFPLEALKAQAVTARTYALRKQNPSRAYDLVDNTNDQVYYGYLAGHGKVEQAVSETRGVCGFYENELAMCYYSASNGGQTERTKTAWPDSEQLAYYAFGADNYDYENPQSTVRSMTVQKIYAEDDTAPFRLRKLLAVELSDRLEALGYTPEPDCIRVLEVSELYADTPSGGADSKLMTMLHLTARIAARKNIYMPQDTLAPVVDSDMEEVSLFSTPEPIPTPTLTADLGASVAAEPQYGPFEELPESVKLDIKIFPNAESALGMDILSHRDNELWSVKERKSSFTIEVRRYGHGVGMSQRGAQWMASKYKMSFEAILDFYYPGMELMQYPEADERLLPEDEALAEDAGPAPTPTPRPTLMPATMEPEDGQWFARVTEIADDSSLNLRRTPDMGGEIVMRLYKNQRLLVLERCPEEGWVKVRTDSAEGYVVEEYLTDE